MIDSPNASDEPRPALPESTEADDADEWVELPLAGPRLGNRQFGLLGLFVLVTVCGVYFAIERVHQGRFGVTVLFGALLYAGIVVPAVLLIGWIMRMVFDGPIPIGVVLLVVLTSAALVLYLWR